MRQSQYPRLPILVVDDDTFELSAVRLILETEGMTNVQDCSDSREVPALLAAQKFSVVILDVAMPHLSGPELLPLVLELQPNATVVFVSATNKVQTAVELLRSGAHDYITKPFDSHRLLATVRASLEKWSVTDENARMREGMLVGIPLCPQYFDHIVTRSPSLVHIFRYIESIGPTELPVLITGETGVGKELLAEAVHKASGRTGPFVAVNLAGLDDLLFSDALFGHIKGAYTGAVGARSGFVQEASGGTLFLDEIGELSAESQVKILRLLQNREYYPLGSDQRARSDARLVFATNQNLEAQIEKGKFRKDLFYRMWSHRVAVPPLRERPEDIRLLVDHFVAKYSKELGMPRPTVAPRFYDQLQTQKFPGNVRELEGVVADALVRSPELLEGTAQEGGASSGVDLTSWANLPTLEELDEHLITEALRRSQGNQGVAARILGLSRTALNKRLHK